MRSLIVIALLLTATPVLTAVCVGDITLKNKGGDVVFSHDNHVLGITALNPEGYYRRRNI